MKELINPKGLKSLTINKAVEYEYENTYYLFVLHSCG